MEQGTSADSGTESPAPVKLCECGCGEPAPIAKLTNTARGQVKGQPVRFIQGHAAKLKAAQLVHDRLEEAPAEVKLCECGCGQPTPIAPMTRKIRGHVKGQPMRFISGHQRGPEGPKPKLRKLFVETGQRIGNSVVLEPEVTTSCPSKPMVRAVRLRCDCGAEYTRAIARVFRNPDVESCGCSRFADITGQRFGKLVAIRRAGSKRTSAGRVGCWLCKCDCGNEALAYLKSLTNGNTRSCGCGRFGPQRGLGIGDAALNGLMRTYQGHARNRGLPWSLTRDDFKRLTSLDCHYCGTAPSQTVKGHPTSGDYVYNGVDRVDSSQGYQLDNCVSACGTCNFAKSDMSYEEFLAWIARLAGFHFFRPDVMPSRMLAGRAGQPAA